MSTLVASPPEPRARKGDFVPDAFVVHVEDGRSLTVPLEWFPRCSGARRRRLRPGQSLKQLVTDALRAKLAASDRSAAQAAPPWMAGFGRLRRLRSESGRVQARIEKEFE